MIAEHRTQEEGKSRAGLFSQGLVSTTSASQRGDSRLVPAQLPLLLLLLLEGNHSKKGGQGAAAMASQQDSGFFEISIKSLLKSLSGSE